MNPALVWFRDFYGFFSSKRHTGDLTPCARNAGIGRDRIHFRRDCGEWPREVWGWLREAWVPKSLVTGSIYPWLLEWMKFHWRSIICRVVLQRKKYEMLQILFVREKDLLCFINIPTSFQWLRLSASLLLMNKHLKVSQQRKEYPSWRRSTRNERNSLHSIVIFRNGVVRSSNGWIWPARESSSLSGMIV